MAANLVVAAQNVAFGKRLPAGIQRLIVSGQILDVLPIDAVGLRNGRHAEGINVRAAFGAVALEIALQSFLPLRHRQFIGGPGEVVHADVGVAVVVRELLDDQF